MKAAIIGALLAASTVLAAPHTARRRAAHEKRLSQRRTSLPQYVEGDHTDLNSTAQYSTNWAGAVLVGTGYTSVSGTIKVPTPKAPAGDNGGSYAASAWVGIDGDTCQTAILQTGVDFTIEDGEASFQAWYEWYPDYAYNFDSMTINAGDEITMVVTSTGTTSGEAIIENKTSGQKVSQQFSNENGALCNTNAEWIVEDFEQGGGLVPFCNFDAVTFTGATVTSNGKPTGVTGSQVLNIKQSNVVLTSCSVSGESDVTCKYV